ncbi:unnamed protein product [Ostreobium quekettii]|uniref:Amine oxidase domain-containing protein n=1 Tax=Ostreobium quekettii TaxID=121088 RepID=A0A8S1JEC9_9CHLO|nr:unnamed protein product [Ostreobium quekettii]|eukprot:evm.model.scf_438.2 EVM.evm.TU.scf_438.2   scf_438:6540-8147(+)
MDSGHASSVRACPLSPARLHRLALLCSALIVLLREAAALEVPACPARLDADVLVLGAGIAGISAGKALHENGVEDFLIIEGTDRVGGRIRNQEFGGIRVEVGANWIHAVDPTGDAPKVNPIWELREKCGLEVAINDWEDSVVYDGDGNEIDDDAFRYEDFETAFNRVVEMSKDLGAQGKGEVTGELILSGVNVTSLVGPRGDVNLKDAFAAAGWTAETPEDVFVEYAELDDCSGERPDKLGLKHFKSSVEVFEAFGEEDAFVTDQRGHAQVVRCLAEDFLVDGDDRLRLSAPVRAMRYRDECVCVDIVPEGGKAGNETVCGRYAIATFSSGVLQDSAFSESPFVEMSPPLPDWKRDALSLTNMTVYLKIFARFSAAFWDDVEFIGRAATPPNAAMDWASFLPMSLSSGKFAPIPANTPIIIANVAGDLARRLARQTVEENTEEMMAVLRGIYGPDIPPPEEVFIPDLHNSPFFRGSWTNYLEGASQETVELLRVPLGALHFAGGYTSVKYLEFTQGAHLEGLRVGQAVATKILTK